MDELMARRVDRLVALSRQLAATNGVGSAAFEAVRREVATEVQRDAGMPIVQAALAKLEGNPAQAHLYQVLRYAEQCFHVDDRILACLVIPVAVRLKAERNGAARLTAANSDVVRQMERLLGIRIDAPAIHLDDRLYTADDIAAASTAALRTHLLGLEAGTHDLPRLGPGRCLVARTDPEWASRYFVGAVVYEGGRMPDLESEEIQEAASSLLWQPGVSLEFAHPDAWRQGICCETRCLGFFYKHQGLRTGEDNIRAKRLRGFLATLSKGGQGTEFCFAEDPDRGVIRLLAHGALMTEEFLWPTHHDEPRDSFLAALAAALAEYFPAVDAVAEIALADYRQRAMALGLFWLESDTALGNAEVRTVTEPEYRPIALYNAEAASRRRGVELVDACATQGRQDRREAVLTHVTDLPGALPPW